MNAIDARNDANRLYNVATVVYNVWMVLGVYIPAIVGGLVVLVTFYNDGIRLLIMVTGIAIICGMNYAGAVMSTHIAKVLAHLLIANLESKTTTTTSTSTQGSIAPSGSEHIVVPSVLDNFQALPGMSSSISIHSDEEPENDIPAEVTLLAEANRLYNNGEKQKAINLYIQISKDYPKFREVWICLSNAEGLNEELKKKAKRKLLPGML